MCTLNVLQCLSNTGSRHHERLCLQKGAASSYTMSGIVDGYHTRLRRLWCVRIILTHFPNRASAESPAGHEHIDIRLMRLLCHMEFSLRASIFPGSHAPQLLELQATRTTPAGPRWECAISFVTHPHTSSPCPHLDNFAQIETSDGQTKLCGHFPSTSGPRGVHPVSVQLLDAQLTSGALL